MQELCRILVPCMVLISSMLFFEGVNAHWGAWWYAVIREYSFLHPKGFIIRFAGLLVAFGPLLASVVWFACAAVRPVDKD